MLRYTIDKEQKTVTVDTDNHEYYDKTIRGLKKQGYEVYDNFVDPSIEPTITFKNTTTGSDWHLTNTIYWHDQIFDIGQMTSDIQWLRDENFNLKQDIVALQTLVNDLTTRLGNIELKVY